MYLTTIILSTFIITVSSQLCEEPGECVDSIFLGSVPANDSADCLMKCRNSDGCHFGSFTPDYIPNLCLLFKTCTSLDTESCPNCETSEISCSQCDIPGLCLVSTYLLSLPKPLQLALAWLLTFDSYPKCFFFKNSFLI